MFPIRRGFVLTAVACAAMVAGGVALAADDDGDGEDVPESDPMTQMMETMNALAKQNQQMQLQRSQQQLQQLQQLQRMQAAQQKQEAQRLEEERRQARAAQAAAPQQHPATSAGQVRGPSPYATPDATNCIAASVKRGASCGHTKSLDLTMQNTCGKTIRIQHCIQDTRYGKKSCGASDLSPGERTFSFVCESNGRYWLFGCTKREKDFDLGNCGGHQE